MLFLDLEVYSEVSITSVPLDVYATHPSTKIVLACAAFDDKGVVEWGEYQSVVSDEGDEFLAMLRTYSGPLCAWNIGFERTILAAQGFPTPISRWTDGMVEARYLGLPGGLKACSKIPFLGVPPEKATKSETLLIKKFCMPLSGKMKPGTSEEWALFVDYCRRDVESLRHIHNYLSQNFPVPAYERRVWELDQKINERGLPIDWPTARYAADEVVRLTSEAKARMGAITGLDNPNSVQQLLPWLQARGYRNGSLGKAFVQQNLDRNGDRLTQECREVLKLRLDSAKSSVKKFSAMLKDTSPDGRARGLYRYAGAHTLRWSGRGFQPQNITRTPTHQATLDRLIVGAR